MALFPPPTLKPSLPSLSSSSSYTPLTSIKTRTLTLKSRNPTPNITISCSSSASKIVRCPTLDRHASLHHRRRFVRKLSTLLLSKPRHFIPLPILRRCRRYLTLPPGRPLLPMIHRYPSFFAVVRSPTASTVSISLTPAALSLFSQISKLSSSSANKLVKLLLLSSHRRLLLSKLVHVAPDLGFSPNFRSRLCNAHPDRFRTVDTSYGRAVELVSCSDDDFETLPVVERVERDRPIIDRPAKFKKVRLRRGLNVKRKHLDRLIRFGELREINPYLESVEALTVEEKEKRACTVVREVLGMTVEKRTLVDHLTHFRKEFGLPNRLRAMLVRHPEMFYVSVKGDRDSVFLVEAYDDKGRLVVEDEMLWAKERLEDLMREGKRMRKERRAGGGLFGDNDKIEDDDEDDEDGEEEFLEGDDDGFEDLFESGIGDDWDDFGGDGDDIEEVKEIVEFWSLNKTLRESSGCEEGEEKLEAW